MGRRKSKKRVIKKAKLLVPTTFDCPFCNHEQTVDCTMDKLAKTGKVTCRICDAKYQTVTNYLTQAVDIYSEWIDECEAENQLD